MNLRREFTVEVVDGNGKSHWTNVVGATNEEVGRAAIESIGATGLCHITLYAGDYAPRPPEGQRPWAYLTLKA